MPTRFFRFCVPVLIAFSLFRGVAHAAPVISEVLWAGSDLSSSDEWLELTGVDEQTALSGWTVTSVNTSGTEVTIARFPDGMSVGPGEYLVVSHFGASQSKLLFEPAVVSADVSLPNSKLLLRLRDLSGAIIDEVDDGVGSPFAGVSASDKKVSMERIDLKKKGNDASNWISAVLKLGLDEGGIVFATPGSSPSGAGIAVQPLPLPQSSSSSGASSGGSASSVCPDPRISLQSGTTSGEDHVTLNIQVITDGKSLASGACQVLFGDGERSDSCNPPSHSYEEVGVYSLRAILPNYCGTTVERTLSIHVYPKGSSSSFSSSSSESSNDPSLASFGPESFVISAVLPNPRGTDPEWIEIANARGQVADLEGWTIRTPLSGRIFTFGSVPFRPGETKRFPAVSLGLLLPDAAGVLELLDENAEVHSAFPWQASTVDQVFRQQKGDNEHVSALVTYVVDGDTFDVRIEGDPPTGIAAVERIRLIGVDAPELLSKDAQIFALANRSKEFISGLTSGKKVELEFDTEYRDSYGRLLAYVTTSDGFLLQNLLLSRGLASVESAFSFSRKDEFLLAQNEGQELHGGVWSFSNKNASADSRIVEQGSSSSPKRIAFTVLSSKSSSHSRSSSRSSAKKPAIKRAKASKKPIVKTVSHSISSIILTGDFTPYVPDLPEVSPLAALIDVPLADEPQMAGDYHAVVLGSILAFGGFAGTVFLKRKG